MTDPRNPGFQDQNERAEEPASVAILNSDERKKIKTLLTHFGIEYNEIPKDVRQKLVPVLVDLAGLLETLPETSTATLINWADVLFAENDEKLNQILSEHIRLLNGLANKAAKTMSYAYVGLNFLGFVLSVASMQNWDMGFLATNIATNITGSSLNYVDSVGGTVTAIRQITQGQIELGLANLASSLQLAGCTVAANIANYTTLINASAATVSSLMGFSYAACMVVNCGIELCEVAKCDRRIKKMEEKRDEIHNNPAEQDKQAPLQKSILIEKAQRANHIRNAKAWAVCAIAMTAVAVISYAALSGLTFGALPAATVAIAGVALLSSIVRKWWVGHKDHVKNLKETLQHKEEPMLLDRLNQVGNKLGDVYTKKVTVITSGFFKTTLSFRTYLEDLLVENPKKLNTILLLLEDKNFDPKKHGSQLEKITTIGVKILHAAYEPKKENPSIQSFNVTSQFLPITSKTKK